MFVIKGFGVIAMVIGAMMIISFLSDSSTSSTASLVIGVVALAVGAALFFLPGRGASDS